MVCHDDDAAAFLNAFPQTVFPKASFDAFRSRTGWLNDSDRRFRVVVLRRGLFPSAAGENKSDEDGGKGEEGQ